MLRVDGGYRSRRGEDGDASSAATVPAAPTPAALAALASIAAVADAATATPEEGAVGVLAARAVASASPVLSASTCPALLTVQIDRRQTVRCVGQIHRDDRGVDDRVDSVIDARILVAVG